MAHLDTEFAQITGHAPRQRPGEVYAGRTLCHLDTTRDLDMVIGGAVISRLASLEPLLLSARWLTAAVAEAFQGVLTGLQRELAAEAGIAGVPFTQLWYLALGPLLGEDAVPEKVMTEFLSRWSAILNLDAAAPAAAGSISPRPRSSPR